MARRWGLGPVFASEWVTGTRRWQVYGGRVLFLGVLFLALACTWGPRSLSGNTLTIQEMALVGRGFFAAIVYSQLTLVLIASPAAMAGVICQEKGQGNLVQLLMTDLSNTEIVLGKMAARMVPIFAMIGCTLPVLTLCTLLGGIDPLALAGAFVISLAVALLVSSIALTFSIWGTKPYEVLLATFAVIAVWLLAFPVWEFFSWLRGLPPLPRWAISAHPFFLAFAPYARPGKVGMIDYVAFTAVALLISAILLLISIAKIRAVVIGQADRSTAFRRKPGLTIFGIGHGPSLDANPVLWYEWHRHRPSVWLRRLIRFYFGLAIGFSLLAIDDTIRPNTPTPGWFPAFVNAFQFAMGLPLLVIAAATSLVEERARGSLDILLTTPLSSQSIVFAKWWSVFRETPRLLWLPCLVALILTCVSERWGNFGRLVFFLTLAAAAWTSIGLALSTWNARLSRAVTSAVVLYTIVTLGWPLMALTVFRDSRSLGEELARISPFHGTFDQTLFLGGAWWYRIAPEMISVWTLTYGVIALALYGATLATFDRTLGRIPEKARRRTTQEMSKHLEM